MTLLFLLMLTEQGDVFRMDVRCFALFTTTQVEFPNRPEM